MRHSGNEGVYHNLYTVRKIVFPDGRTTELTPNPHVVMNDFTAFMVTDMLKSVVSSGGTGVRAKVDFIDGW
ncbi:hypothetical protein KHA80_01125 [Anaerobacillus sp. HL2]|nr:hypothetical protein KHA80_01125 [Anaerobacillus sp. HL2]